MLMRIGRYDDAVRAYHNSITYNGDSAGRRADLGEALAGAAGGVVTSEAKAEFERAVALDADEVKARYFLGLAAEQDGRARRRPRCWRAMLEKAPPDAPWRPLAQAALGSGRRVCRAGVAGRRDGRRQGHERGRRDTMIHTMVDRLASRLKQNGDDVEGGCGWYGPIW